MSFSGVCWLVLLFVVVRSWLSVRCCLLMGGCLLLVGCCLLVSRLIGWLVGWLTSWRSVDCWLFVQLFVCLRACFLVGWGCRWFVVIQVGCCRPVAKRLQEFDTPLEGLTCRRGIAQIAPDRYGRDGPEFEPWSSKNIGWLKSTLRLI